jgi:lipoprotein-anchoring transpeptidase ErfK/SrfK
MSNRFEQQPRGWSRRGVLAALGAVPAAALTVGAGPAEAAPAPSPRPTITVTPADGTRKAAFTRPVEVTVADGTLASVQVTGNDGTALAGSYDEAGTTWTSTANPYSGTTYTVTAEAAGGAATTATFTTESPGETFVAHLTPEAGSTCGVGMPVSITFSHAVTDRAAVERAITVTAEPAVEVVGHWFGDTRLDFRPESYWAAGTTVTVRLRLRDVEGADGVHGVRSKDVTFRVGRAQISTVDLAGKRMTVVRDGRAVATYPVTGGDAEHPTWSGIMVISERFEETRMASSTVGLGDEYDISDVPHAQRLTTSGTFLHGNYWAGASVFGGENTSHGCIGLQDVQGADDTSADGYRFYDSSMPGDVVVVTGAGARTVDPANGLNGWNLPWRQWRAGSAL